MKKKLVSLLLVLALVLGSFSMVFATPADVAGTDYEEDVAKLMAIGVLAGYPDGTFKPEKTVTRAEFAKMIVVASGLEDAAILSAGATQFADVTADHWASGYINVATQKKFIEGYPNGNYGPEDKITYAQMFTILIRAIGLGDVVEKDGVWPSNYLAKAVQLELNDGLAKGGNEAATRGDVAIAFVNTMTQSMWGATSVNSDGTVDYGPIAGQTMLTELGFSTLASTAAVDNVVTATQQYGDKDADEITTVLGGTDELADSCMQDPDEFYGQEVTLWLDDDGDVVYIENETDEDDIIYDYFDSYASPTLTLDNEDEYDWDAGTVGGYYNMTAVAGGILPATTFGDKTAVKLVLDADGDVEYFTFWNATETAANVSTDVVKDIDDDEIDFELNEISDIDLEDWNDDIDDDKKIVEVVRNGEVASLEDIEAGDVVAMYKIAANKYYKFVVTDDVVNGTLTKIQGSKAYIGTTSYTFDADAQASIDEGDTVIKWAASTQADFVSESVSLSLDAYGRVAYISTDAEAVAENYAIFNKDISGGSYSVVGGVQERYIEVVNEDEEEVVLSFEDTTKSNAAYVTLAAAAPKTDFVKYEINDDGYVENVTVYDTAATNYSADDIDVDTVGAVTFDDDPEYLKMAGKNYYVNNDTVIFVVNAANDVTVYETWDDVANAAKTALKNVVVKYDGGIAEYVTVDSTAVASDTEYAIFIDEGINEDGLTVVLNQNGTDTTYDNQAAAPANFAGVTDGTVMSYTINADGDYVADAATTVTVNGTAGVTAAANGVLFVYQNTVAGDYQAIVDVDTDNMLFEITAGTFALEDDVLIYDLDDPDGPVMIEFADIDDDNVAVVLDSDNDDLIDFIFLAE